MSSAPEPAEAPKPPAERSGDWRRLAGGAALIVLAVFAVYWPALRGQFLWDDLLVVHRNPLVTGELAPGVDLVPHGFPADQCGVLAGVAGVGQSPGGLPRRERAAPCGRRGVAVAGAGAVENPGGLAGRDDLRRPSGLRGLRGVDFGAEEHPVAALLPAEPPVVSAARLRTFAPRTSHFALPSSTGFRCLPSCWRS